MGLSMVSRGSGSGFGSILRSRPSSWAFASLCLPGSQWHGRYADSSKGFSTLPGKVPRGGSADEEETVAGSTGVGSREQAAPGDFSLEDTKWKATEAPSFWQVPGLYLELSKAKLSALVTLTAMVSSYSLDRLSFSLARRLTNGWRGVSVGMLWLQASWMYQRCCGRRRGLHCALHPQTGLDFYFQVFSWISPRILTGIWLQQHQPVD